MEALVSIKRECEAIENHEDNVVVNAPHTPRSKWPADGTIPIPGCRPPIRSNGYRGRSSSHVSKIDNGYGDRNLVCTCCEF